MAAKITHYVCRSTACGSANNGDHRVPVSLAAAPWAPDAAREETRPNGRMVRRPYQPPRPLAGVALTATVKRIIREVAASTGEEG